MQVEHSTRRPWFFADWAALAVVAAWPFAFLAPYTLNKIVVGNDFIYLYFNYKAYFLGMLQEGHFPLWSPSEGAGFPFFSNPFAQSFYPLNLLYLAYCKVLGRFVAWDYQMLTILALSIYGVGLYLWLRRLGIVTAVALLAVVVSLSSLKVTELLRFPNAAHSAAWMPWLLYAATVATDRRCLVPGAAIFGIALLMLFTAGYPYFVVYALFLVAPYLVAMSVSASRRSFVGADAAETSRKVTYVAALGCSALLAALLSLPWLQHVQSLMAQTVDRGTPNFAYATEHLFGPLSTLGSWIFPPSASMEGWYYFGIATTLIIALNLLSAAVCGERPSRLLLLAMLTGWMALIVYFTWGRESVLFTWTWQNVPVLNQMRVWGRMNIILVPAIALLLALSLDRYFELLSAREESGANGKFPLLLGGFIAITGGVLALQWYLYSNQMFDGYWNSYFKQAGEPGSVAWGKPWRFVRSFDERRFILYTFLASSALVALWLGSRQWPHKSLWRFAGLVVFLAISTKEMFHLSNYQWMYPGGSKTPIDFNAVALLRANFEKTRSISGPTISYPSLQYGVGVIPNWGFSRHVSLYLQYFDQSGRPRPDAGLAELAAAKRFFGADERAERIFFTRRIDHRSPAGFIDDADRFARATVNSYKILHYDGDRLELAVAAGEPCWLTFVDNWDPNWRAKVNGKPIAIEVTLGSYKAVRLPAGESRLVFSYEPRLFPWLGK